MADFTVDTLTTVLRFRRDDKAIDEVQRRLKGYQDRLNSISRNMSIAGAVLTGVGVAVGRTLLDFDRASNTLAARLGSATVDQLEALSEQARELGRTTSKSASDVVRAQTELAAAGFEVNEVLSATPNILNLAVAGELSMADAAQLAGNQLNTFGLHAGDTGRVVDVLVRAANSAATSVGDLAPAFRQVAPQAAALGLSIEETAAALGTLRSGGLAAEQSGTAFRGVLAVLQEEPSARVRQGFQRLGLSFEEVRRQLEQGDLVGVFQQLQRAGLDSSSSLAIFGRESQAAALLLAQDTAALGDYTAALERADGAAQQSANIISSNLAGSFAEFKSTTEGLQLELGDSGLLRVINGLLKGVTGLARAFSDAPGPVKTFGAYVLAVGPILLGVGILLRGLSWALSGYSIAITTATWLTTAWNQSNTILRLRLAAIAVWGWITAAATWALTVAQRAATASIWGTVGASLARRVSLIVGTALTWAQVAATSALTVAQWALNIAMTANPIGLIILAIAALIAILVGVGFAIWRFRDDIVTAFNAALNWAREHWPLLVAILLGPFGIIIWAVWKWRDQVIGAIKGVIDWVKSAIDKVKGFFGGGSIDVNINDNTRRATARTPSAQPGSPEPLLPGAQRGRVPTFHQGGIMGENGPAILQRGEMVLPPGLTTFLLGLPDLLTNVSPMMAAGPGALLPAIPGPAPVINQGDTYVYPTMAQGAITVQVTVGSTDGADIREAARLTAVEMRREIAAIVPAWFRDAMSDLANGADSIILR